MAPRTIMAVGGHIGDMDLAAGPLLAQTVLDGGRAVLVALTPGERGHPTMPVDEYRQQKIAEGQAFAERIGAELTVFDDLSDGFLTPADSVAARVAVLIRRYRPDTLIAHWRRSIHTDHEHASTIASRARFLAGLPGWQPDDPAAADENRRHAVTRFWYAENWEDAHGFVPDAYVPVSNEAFDTWRVAIAGQAFARGETYGFRYIDYYTAQLTLRGCLARTEHALAVSNVDDAPTVLADA
jgi:LmbE family N-acetylglucosaminyl deacetylase